MVLTPSSAPQETPPSQSQETLSSVLPGGGLFSVLAALLGRDAIARFGTSSSA